MDGSVGRAVYVLSKQNTEGEKMYELLMIDHVCLIVRDVLKSKEYYEMIFDVKGRPHPRDDKTYMFESPGIHFFLIQADCPRDFLEKQHLSIRTNNLEMAKKVLEDKGITQFEIGCFQDFIYTNYKWLEWRDPDGIRLEFAEVIK